MRLAFTFGFAAALCATVAMADENPLAEFLWEKRAVIVFADSPKDPRFVRQMEDFARREADTMERDVVVLTDATPAANSPLRKELRPRGFMMILIDKDGEIKLRSPHPMAVDALTRMIDRTVLRQQEIDERRGE